MKKHLSTILLVLVFLVGLCVMLYPSFSDYVNSKNQSRAIANYDKTTSEMEKEDLSHYIEVAKAYNERLFQNKISFTDENQLSGYKDILNVGNTDIMGYISIDKIKLKLPIYHGTSDGVLQIAVGHLEGSSLPVGGSNTHTILMAHRGLPRAKLFTDLDQMEIGDYFTISVLDQKYFYEVDKIQIVEPQEVNKLKIVEGQDYCTLVTCTPYGVNTHRLLITGRRCDNIKNQQLLAIDSEARLIDPMLVVPVVATPMLMTLLFVLLFKYRKRR